jgi:glycosyltransferase involved in cell wall biosynthesis
MKKIRVLEIISGFAIEGPLGGIERFGIELAQALGTDDSITPIVCGMWAYDTPYEHQWVEYLQEKGVEAFIPAIWEESKPYHSFIRAYKNTLEIMQGTSVDIIHSHCQFGDILALLLRKPLQAKALIRTVHNEREWGKRPLRRHFLTGALYPLKFDRELGVAQQVVDNLDQRFVARVIKKKAIRAYNALNLTRFHNVQVNRTQKKQELNIPADALVIGTVGRLTPQKGYDVLLETAVIVLQKIPHAFFLIIGDGELAHTLKQQAHDLGIEKQVLFTGSRNDIEELFTIMDVFVNSSLWEGLPTVMLESMAACIPIVATEVSGNVELIKHQQNGLLVPASNPRQLAQAIHDTLTASPENIQKRCRSAYHFVQDHFSILTVAQQHEAIYSELMGNG